MGALQSQLSSTDTEDGTPHLRGGTHYVKDRCDVVYGKWKFHHTWHFRDHNKVLLQKCQVGSRVKKYFGKYLEVWKGIQHSLNLLW